MIKIPRFITEFAAYGKKTIRENHEITDDVKNSKIDEINKVVYLFNRGLITVADTIEIINHTISAA